MKFVCDWIAQLLLPVQLFFFCEIYNIDSFDTVMYSKLDGRKETGGEPLPTYKALKLLFLRAECN